QKQATAVLCPATDHCLRARLDAAVPDNHKQEVSIMQQSSRASPAVVPAPEAIKQGIISWTESSYGGRVIRVEQVRRWRPIWRVDVDVDGVINSLAFKGP